MKLFVMTNFKGGNVFHLSAFWNEPRVFELLRPETEYLARERDRNGDLPIHIASKMGHAALIEKLHTDERINSSIPNHKRSAALDISLHHLRGAPTLQKALAHALLSGASAKRLDVIILKPEARDEACTNRDLPNLGGLKDVETIIPDDSKEDRMGSGTPAGPPLDGGASSSTPNTIFFFSSPALLLSSEIKGREDNIWAALES
ncbi:hypothetical protein NL676_028539 [Syzygium grande]|nr:hypothetical protein NL676_028539 [Syzygium grande]